MSTTHKVAWSCIAATLFVVFAYFFYEMNFVGKEGVQKTRATILLHTDLATDFKREKGRYPHSIAEMVSWSPRDGWGRQINYLHKAEGGGFFYSSGENGIDEQGGGDDIRGTTLP